RSPLGRAPPRRGKVTNPRAKGGDHPRPLLTVGPGDRLPQARLVQRNGRTSTFRLQALDPSVASLSATSRSAASMIQKPARYSFDSRNGPSVTIACSPRLSIRVAGSGPPTPPAKTPQ